MRDGIAILARSQHNSARTLDGVAGPPDGCDSRVGLGSRRPAPEHVSAGTEARRNLGREAGVKETPWQITPSPISNSSVPAVLTGWRINS